MSPQQAPPSQDAQHLAPYADALEAHRARSGLRFMIPGHAAGGAGGSDRLRDFLGARALELDIPQLVEGIDLGANNAFDQARRLAASAWGARTSWFLTNGASQGNRMALQAIAALGDRVLVQRSCHSSVYDGLVMSGARPEYIFPEFDPHHGIAHGITPETAERALSEAAAEGQPFAALVLVSPSYFGVVSDIAAIATSCHNYGAALIVDGSWGAHFGFHPDLPESPTRQGADVVLTSVHKLGGSLTQTAFLHLCDTPVGARLEPALDAASRLTESTSLNSLLLASLDIARAELATGSEAMGAALASAAELRELVAASPGLRLAEPDFLARPGSTSIDPLHVSIDVRGRDVSGPELKSRLASAEPPVFAEIASPTTIVALIGPRSSPNVTGLMAAIDACAPPQPRNTRADELSFATPDTDDLSRLPTAPAPGERVLTPREAYLARSESVPATAAEGRVSAAMLAAYPPGIPNAVPGERLTAELITYLRETAALPGSYIRGAEDPEVTHIRVLLE